MPRTTEELRLRHRIIGHAWLFLKMKHTNRQWLSDLDIRTFPIFSDYLLGRHVYGCVISSTSGRTHHPPWQLILAYELEVRRRACEMVVDGSTLASALAEVCKDAGHRERYFLAPFTLGAASPSPEVPPPPQYDGLRRGRPDRRNQPYDTKRSKRKGGGKGKDGMKGKGLGKDKVKFRLVVTESGQQICFRWNDEPAACKGDCKRAHVCTKCRGKHAQVDCRSGQEVLKTEKA